MKRYLYHNVGQNACYGKALEYLAKDDPQPNDTLMARDFLHLNGSTIEPHEEIICDSCGKFFYSMPRTKDIKE